MGTDLPWLQAVRVLHRHRRCSRSPQGLPCLILQVFLNLPFFVQKAIESLFLDMIKESVCRGDLQQITLASYVVVGKPRLAAKTRRQPRNSTGSLIACQATPSSSTKSSERR